MQTAQVIPFDFEKHPVRAIAINGEPWFVASDICKALDIANTTQALQALDCDERSMFNIGRQGQANIVNESGLFTLILRSRDATKPGTPQHRFRKWVTAEVLPAIRKHGRYDDSEGKMNTLIGQTIGTDGFHMLGAVVKGKVSSLPATVQRRATMKIWSQTHAAFGVRSAADIPADQLDAARNFIAAYVVLEGEYLPKQEQGGMHFDKYEVQHIYLLMSRIHALQLDRERVFEVGTLLESRPLIRVFDQINEARSSFAILDKRRNELHQNYRTFGMDGGYALTA